MTSAPSRPCPLCDHGLDAPTFVLKERFFATLEPFEYVQCPGCQAIQIVDVPADLARHYPANYYSYTSVASAPTRAELVRKRAYAEVMLRTDALAGRVQEHPWVGWLRGRAGTRSRILDIGCGNGELLGELRGYGFRRLFGLERFLPDQAEIPPGVEIMSEPPASWDASFDIVMMHHSLEHMPDQVAALREAARLTARGGHILIRIPLGGTALATEYGEFWSGLDAPRHLITHTVASFEAAAAKAGLQVLDLTYDATAREFVVSELWQRGESLAGVQESALGQFFSPAQLASFGSRAAELNASGDGDQGCFVLTPLPAGLPGRPARHSPGD